MARKPQTLGQRLEKAKANSNQALAVFIEAGEELGKQNEELTNVISEIDLQVNALTIQRNTAVETVNKNEAVQVKLLDIIK